MVEFFLGHIPDFLWGLACFVIFVGVLFKLAVRQVLAAVDAREAKIRKDLTDAEAAAVEARKLREANEVERKAHEARISEMLAEARRDAEALKSKLAEQGRTEIDAMRTRALREIEAARHAVVSELRGHIAEVAVLVAEKAIGERLDVNKHEALIDAAVARFDAHKA